MEAIPKWSVNIGPNKNVYIADYEHLFLCGRVEEDGEEYRTIVQTIGPKTMDISSVDYSPFVRVPICTCIGPIYDRFDDFYTAPFGHIRAVQFTLRIYEQSRHPHVRFKRLATTYELISNSVQIWMWKSSSTLSNTNYYIRFSYQVYCK